MLDFLALGNLTLDDVVTADGRIAPAQLGGNGVYAAAGMRLWGEAVALVGVVGNDFPQRWLDALAEANIDLSGVRQLDQPHALRSRVFYFTDGHRTDRVDEARSILPPGVETELDLVTEYTAMGSPLHRRTWPLFSPTPGLLSPTHLTASFAHLSPGPLTNSRANAAFLKQKTARHMTLTLDWPWWDWDDARHADEALLGHLDYLLPSQEEFDIHVRAQPDYSPDQVALALLTLGPRALVVKRGARGAELLRSGARRWQHVPIYPTTAVDPTGAGDAFCGGFLVGIARTADPFQAALYGAVSASFLVQDFGVLHSLTVSPAEADKRLHVLRETALSAGQASTTRPL